MKTSNNLELSYSEFLRYVVPHKKRKLREKILKKQSGINEDKNTNPVIESKINFAIA
jgi:hypothetical protein